MASRLILVLGDLFIPDRAADIPAKFRKLLTPGKIGQTICLGNLTDAATYDFLRGLAPDMQTVRGDFDLFLGGDALPIASTNNNTANPNNPNAAQAHNTTGGGAASYNPSALPISKVVTHGRLRIGFTHGHTIVPPGDADALLIAARHMDVDVLLWGGTHRFEAYELEGRFFVNPGSATGATSTGWWADGEEPVPSFCLIDVQGDVLVLYVYQLKDGEDGAVSVEKVSYRKEVVEDSA